MSSAIVLVMPTTKRVARPIDEMIGKRLKHLRESATPRLTIEQFGKEMRARVGQGWHPPAVLRVENGKQPMRVAELAAAADIFHCTIADIVSDREPVSLGGDDDVAIVARLDAVMGGDDAMPEAVAFSHFERAADALNEQRLAEDRYRHEIDIVRRVIARDDDISAALRGRIDAYRRRAHDLVSAEIDEMDADDVEHARLLGVEPPPRPSVATPSIVASNDALHTYPIPANQWTRRLIRKDER